MCKIAIVDKYSLFSSGIKYMLKEAENFNVIAEAENEQELKNKLNNTLPDVIVIDILHCTNAGIYLLKRIKKYFPETPLLLITSKENKNCFADYLNFGTVGFVYTDDSPDELSKAIQVVCSGKEFFKEYVIKYWIDADSKANKKSKGDKTKLKSLSPREIEVVKLFCDGLTYREIGKKLFISHRTVETHKNNILKKLKLKTKAEMIKYAIRNKYTTN